MSQEEARMEELFEAAHRDDNLKAKLLRDPTAVAKDWGVKFGDREIEQLQKLGAFMEVAEDFKRGTLFRRCDPRVCYPITVWRDQVMIDISQVIEKWKWVYYPPEPGVIRRMQRRLLR